MNGESLAGDSPEKEIFIGLLNRLWDYEIVNRRINFPDKPSNMRYCFILLFLLVFSLNSFATAQYPDKIIFNGKEYSLHTNPLEKYFEEHPDKRPKGGVWSTALWRGYVATFEIKDSGLVVKDIMIELQDSTSRKSKWTWKSVYDLVFPEQPLKKVDWVSGLLVLPHGKMVEYVHMGYASVYEHYLLLEIDKGVFKKSRSFTKEEYLQYKVRQFEVFRKTETYSKLKAELKKENYSDELIESFLWKALTDYTTTIIDG